MNRTWTGINPSPTSPPDSRSQHFSERSAPILDHWGKHTEKSTFLLSFYYWLPKTLANKFTVLGQRVPLSLSLLILERVFLKPDGNLQFIGSNMHVHAFIKVHTSISYSLSVSPPPFPSFPLKCHPFIEKLNLVLSAQFWIKHSCWQHDVKFNLCLVM